MKKTIIRTILAAIFLVASGSMPVVADSFPVPLCYPNPCSVN